MKQLFNKLPCGTEATKIAALETYMSAMKWIIPIMCTALLALAFTKCSPVKNDKALPCNNWSVFIQPLIVDGQHAPEWRSVVFVDMGDSMCSGTVVDENTIITAKHCEGPTYRVWGNGDKWLYAHKTVAADDFDVRVLEFDFDIWLPCSRVGERSPDVGTECTLVGYGYDNDNDSGTIRSAMNTIDRLTWKQQEFLRSGGEGVALWGDSGGATFGPLNELVGVITSGEPYKSSFSLRVDTVSDFLEEFINPKTWLEN